MTGTLPTYRLACGCTDWCNCVGCQAGVNHHPETIWTCDEHGRTTVTGSAEPDPLPVIGSAGEVAVVYCNESFTFDAGHRMRAAHCLVCQELIGGQSVAVIGVAALAGDACQCGSIVSDVFLLHADHLPMEPDEIRAAIHRGLRCNIRNH